MLMMHLETFP